MGAREDYYANLGDRYGCSDGGCIFGHRGGMHTNGGCRCAYFVGRDEPKRRRLEAGIRALRKVVEEEA